MATFSPEESAAMEELYDDHADTLDDPLAPLKRNHACLNCKKRKVKCDGARPHCAPCLRSHGHAIRAANRVGSRVPTLFCEWADADSPSGSPNEPLPVRTTPPAPKKKISGSKKLPLEKERANRQEEEKEKLLGRIAELEARLAGLTPPSSEASGSGSGSAYTKTSPNNLPQPGSEPEFDFSGLFMVPTNWPRNLPAPYLLEHLVEVFFTAVPQSPRILNRPKLMARIRLPPKHPNFPHPALLHSICATASGYTAWVTSVPLGALESGVRTLHARGETLESFEDFGLSQAESAHRAIHQTHQICQVGSSDSLFEIFQAEILVSDVWLGKGMYLKGWSNAGQAARYVKGLELANRSHPRRYKCGILAAPANAVDRQERLTSTWQTFISEAFSGVTRYWPMSLDDREMFARLPAGSSDVDRKDGDIPENPQDAKSPKLYSEHPVHDSYVLLCKVAMLCSRAARFGRDWAQRDVRAGDESLGMELAIFKDIVRDIYILQRTIPDQFKNVFRIAPGAINAELLALHIMPNICILMLYESFIINGVQPTVGGEKPMVKAYEAIMGILHLIPSNTDVSYLLTSDLAFNIHGVGRIIIDFMQHAIEQQSYDLAVRYRSDLTAIQALLERFGARHPLGLFSKNFLDNYLEAILSGKEPTSECSAPKIPDEVGFAPLQITDNIMQLDSRGSAVAGGAYFTMGIEAGNLATELDLGSWSFGPETMMS